MHSLADLFVSSERKSLKPSGTITPMFSSRSDRLALKSSYASATPNWLYASYGSSLGSSAHIKRAASILPLPGTFGISIPSSSSPVSFS